MSDIVMCNHCQDLFKRENTTYGKVEGFWNGGISADLCGECRSELDEWFNPEETKSIKEWLKKK